MLSRTATACSSDSTCEEEDTCKGFVVKDGDCMLFRFNV